MKSTLRMALAVAMAVSSGSSEAAAQLDSFLLIPEIPGESTDAKHKDWIDLVALGQTLEPLNKRLTTCDAIAVKRLDAASPALWAAVASGQIYPEMRVEMTRPSEGVTLLEQRLQNVRVLRVAFQTDAGVPGETVTLRPRSMVISYTKTDPKTGKPEGRVSSTVDCQQ